MTTNTKWKSHTKIKDNVLTVLGSSNQLDTHFSYIILSNGFPLSNTGHQLNNHKHNTHPHTHLPGHRCIDAPHRHCTPSNHRRMLKRYCWLKGCHSASQQLRQTISMHLQSVLCTTLYACICPHCHLSSRNVCNAVEFFVCSEGQWSNEYSYAGFASSLTSTIRHPAAPKPEKKILKGFSLRNLSAARKYTTLILVGLLDSWTSRTTHPTTKLHTPEDMNLQERRWKNLKCRTQQSLSLHYIE